MKKLLIVIYALGLPTALICSSTSKISSLGWKGALKQKVQEKTIPYIKPIQNYIDANPMLSQAWKIYTNPKNEKSHAFIYGFKSPHYQEMYYNPAFDELKNYWQNMMHDSHALYHIHTIQPLLKNLHEHEKKEHRFQIDNYLKSYNKYQQTNQNVTEKIKHQRELLLRTSELQKALPRLQEFQPDRK